MKDISKRGMNTKIIHAGQHIDPATGAVATPIYQTSTFAFETPRQGAAASPARTTGYIYTRMGNPTIAALEEEMAQLEEGSRRPATASGMAAVNIGVHGLPRQGHPHRGHRLGVRPLPDGARARPSRFGVEFFVDTADLPTPCALGDPAETKLLYVETPANPTLKLTDIAACAEIAHEHGALLVVDNTFA